jgi:hypothetical protein
MVILADYPLQWSSDNRLLFLDWFFVPRSDVLKRVQSSMRAFKWLAQVYMRRISELMPL